MVVDKPAGMHTAPLTAGERGTLLGLVQEAFPGGQSASRAQTPRAGARPPAGPGHLGPGGDRPHGRRFRGAAESVFRGRRPQVVPGCMRGRRCVAADGPRADREPFCPLRARQEDGAPGFCRGALAEAARLGQRRAVRHRGGDRCARRRAGTPLGDDPQGVPSPGPGAPGLPGISHSRRPVVRRSGADGCAAADVPARGTYRAAAPRDGAHARRRVSGAGRSSAPCSNEKEIQDEPCLPRPRHHLHHGLLPRRDPGPVRRRRAHGRSWRRRENATASGTR